MKRFLFLLLVLTLLLSSCSMEEVIPNETNTFSMFQNHSELYRECVEAISMLEYDCLISKTNYYAPKGSEDFSDYYIQNMTDLSFSKLDIECVKLLFESTDVKLVDLVYHDDLMICSFDMCTPGRSFDYGIYYVSKDQEIYIGDPSVSLFENGNGYNYEEKASFGVKFTYYTEKITEHFYYYEIM